MFLSLWVIPLEKRMRNSLFRYFLIRYVKIWLLQTALIFDHWVQSLSSNPMINVKVPCERLLSLCEKDSDNLLARLLLVITRLGLRIISTWNFKVCIHEKIQATSKMSAILCVKPFNKGSIIPLIKYHCLEFWPLPALLENHIGYIIGRVGMMKPKQTKSFKCPYLIGWTKWRVMISQFLRLYIVLKSIIISFIGKLLFHLYLLWS